MRLFLLVCALAPITACAKFTEASPPIAGAPEVVLVASEMRFSPTDVVLPAGAVNVKLRNDGESDHDFTIPALGVQLVAKAGHTVTAGLRDLLPGRYDAYCSMLGHADAGMRLSVTVR